MSNTSKLLLLERELLYRRTKLLFSCELNNISHCYQSGRRDTSIIQSEPVTTISYKLFWINTDLRPTRDTVVKYYAFDFIQIRSVASDQVKGEYRKK